MHKNDGGPAFPGVSSAVTEFSGMPVVRDEPGMSLRDWFAGQALAGMLSNPHSDEGAWVLLASDSYRAADAMLAARGGDNAG